MKKHNFWDIVNKCKHEESTDSYLVNIACNTPHCQGIEYHCKKCGVYVIECGCGSCNGLSGWSHSRWRTFLNEKENS